VASVSPADGTVLAGAAKGGNFFLNLDRPVDPSTVTSGNSGTVQLHRNSESGSDPGYTVNCSNTPCTTITIHPSSTLGEGRYTLTATGLKSEEGVTTPRDPFAAHYAVPFLEGGPALSTTTPCLSSATSSTPGVPLTVTDPNENGTLDFDWSSTGAWSIQAYNGASAIGSPLNGPAGSGHGRLPFPLAIGNPVTVSFRLTVTCAGTSTSASATNLLASRVP
jgi:hypothetical protein